MPTVRGRVLVPSSFHPRSVLGPRMTGPARTITAAKMMRSPMAGTILIEAGVSAILHNVSVRNELIA